MSKKTFGSVIERKDRKGSYRAKYTYKGQTVTKTFPDRLSAQAWLNSEKGLIDADKAGITKWTTPSDRKREEQALERRRTLFCDYVENTYIPEWLEYKSDGGKAEESTVYQRKENLKKIRKADFWKTPIQSINAADIERWKNTIPQPWARYHTFKTCKAIFERAVAEGVIEKSPFTTVKSPKRPKSQQALIPVAQADELKAIYDLMPEYSRISVYLGGVLGLRIGEICVLRVEDIDFNRGTLYVHHSRNLVTHGVKGGKSNASNATIHAGTDIMNMLREQCKGKQPHEFVIKAKRAESIAPQTLRNQLQKARIAAGRPDLRYHTFRKTAITTATQMGATPADTKKFGRHDDYKTSFAYYQMAGDEERLTDIANRVDSHLMPHEPTEKELEKAIAETEKTASQPEKPTSRLKKSPKRVSK